MGNQDCCGVGIIKCLVKESDLGKVYKILQLIYGMKNVWWKRKLKITKTSTSVFCSPQNLVTKI